MLIVGGGMVGVLYAYFLRHAGAPYVLVGAKTLYNGVTRNIATRTTSQHRLIYDKLIWRFDADRTRRYLPAQEVTL